MRASSQTHPAGPFNVPGTFHLKAAVAFGVLAFWALHQALGGLRWDHIAGGAVFLGLFYGEKRTQPLFEFALPLILMLAVYDLQSYFAGALRPAEVHLEAPYKFDLAFFGIATPEGAQIPSQWLQRHTHPFLDFVTGLAYINFVPVFLLVAAWFRFGLARWDRHRDGDFLRRNVRALMWGMLILNIACCSVYYLYPAAPPWYIDRYGFELLTDVPPDPAGGARFDALTGSAVYAAYYSRTPNVFGAVPSIHAAFPLLTLYFAFRLKSLRGFSIFFFLLINFSALYLNHHFVFDLIAGWIMALGVAFLVDRVANSPAFSKDIRIPAFQRGS